MAAQAEDIRRLKERLEGHPGPVLSVYLSVNARIPENQGQAYKVRLKDALREMEGLSEELAGRVRESVEGQVHQHARTVIFFAAEDGLFERYDLQLDLPEAYRFGKPYLAPLVLGLDEHESYGVALVEAEEFRFFVSTPMGDPDEGSEGASSGYFREVDLKPQGLYPVGGGSTDMDPAGHTQQSHIHRFFKQAGETTQKLIARDNVKNLIIAGTKERISEFRDALPEPVRERIVAEGRVATNAPEGEILQQFEEIQQEAERKREDRLIEQARENGVRGSRPYRAPAGKDGSSTIALFDLEARSAGATTTRSPSRHCAEEFPYCGGTREYVPHGRPHSLATARCARLEYVRALKTRSPILQRRRRRQRTGSTPPMFRREDSRTPDS